MKEVDPDSEVRGQWDGGKRGISPFSLCWTKKRSEKKEEEDEVVDYLQSNGTIIRLKHVWFENGVFI